MVHESHGKGSTAVKELKEMQQQWQRDKEDQVQLRGFELLSFPMWYTSFHDGIAVMLAAEACGWGHTSFM